MKRLETIRNTTERIKVEERREERRERRRERREKGVKGERREG